MTTIFIVILFVIQIISFYILALLYTKVSNFNDLEKKQRKLMDEMDDSITAYLTELKDENDRLIEQLDTNNNKAEKTKKRKPYIDKVSEQQAKPPTFDVTTPIIPLNIALKSYGTPKQPEPIMSEIPIVAEEEIDERTRVIRLSDAGESNENIAKILGKGRTEIELILKFR